MFLYRAWNVSVDTFPIVGISLFHFSNSFVASLYVTFDGNSFVRSVSVHKVSSFTSITFVCLPSIFPYAVASNIILT
ncbi:hypothetical protein QP555_08015 [Peptoniphilus lacrimalis]|uniref:hypothetical protein n=1 Tax=Peptoniphilus lacrimalis TaxID=33031 RepID=UPI0023FA0F4C|nr:hypothetical protein [Peptoniphilus lacrimalis]MDK7722952.1 hypothetical protein [Peptoniphilus lacrimalis]MDK7732554.1 hypothetical protein [Peptoniphilus lacrimalis]MDK8282464.1 hypothetical protein [Peptoniphilus lacrimalis]